MPSLRLARLGKGMKSFLVNKLGATPSGGIRGDPEYVRQAFEGSREKHHRLVLCSQVCMPSSHLRFSDRLSIIKG